MWHDYPMLYKACAKCKGQKLNSQNELEYVKLLMHNFSTSKNPAGINTSVHMLNEYLWNKADRPYYDLYPSVATAFTKVDLNKVTCKQLELPLPQLLIRFQKGKELTIGKSEVRSIFVAMSKSKEDLTTRGLLVAIDDGLVDKGNDPDGFPIPVHTLNCITLPDDETIEQRLEFGRANPYCEDTVDNDMVTACYRLVVAICLLRDNPDLIEPEPLEADRKKWEETHDPKLLEKAAKRGKRCWSIGKHIEVAPHFRTPHFAIRWMGKGILQPVLRPIKGSVVRRKVIEEVPTDWLGEEAPEAVNV